jgi:hypothetical protein
MDPIIETTEEEHAHQCDECGDVWTHADAECEGPRYKGPSSASLTCPQCEEERQ